jgi:hypothetical protein
VDTTRRGQQQTGERFHPSHPHTKPKGSGKHGWARRLDGSGQPVRAVVVGRYPVDTKKGQVFEKWERKNEVENSWGRNGGEGHIEGFDG